MPVLLKDELHELLDVYRLVCRTQTDVERDPQTVNLLNNSRFRIISRLLLIAFSTSDNQFRQYAEKTIKTTDEESVCALFDEIICSIKAIQ
ncbi:hypothetical protein ACH7BS_24030 [Klebsiella aerogenes]|uniref:hypothetical protein n=1 Tax=Klebsiella aerogenes TaxID=548 RepID=UPI0037B9DDCA